MMPKHRMLADVSVVGREDWRTKDTPAREMGPGLCCCMNLQLLAEELRT